MRTYSIGEARNQLSRLVENAANGESFVIAKAGKPMVKVVALDAAKRPRRRRFGFMAGQIKVPKNFKTMGEKKIQHLFEGTEDAEKDDERFPGQQDAQD